MIFIRSINSVGALVNPNDITKNSQCPYLVLKVVFGIPFSPTHTRWYLDLKSIFEKYLAPFSLSNKLLILKKGYIFFIVAFFIY